MTPAPTNLRARSVRGVCGRLLEIGGRQVLPLVVYAPMAREVRRVARLYLVQTPSYWFPTERNFHIPGWQWMPRAMRIGLLWRFRRGWNGRTREDAKAAERVDEVRLLTWREMRRLFPNGDRRTERFGGLVRSRVSHGGVARARDGNGA